MNFAENARHTQEGSKALADFFVDSEPSDITARPAFLEGKTKILYDTLSSIDSSSFMDSFATIINEATKLTTSQKPSIGQLKKIDAAVTPCLEAALRDKNPDAKFLEIKKLTDILPNLKKMPNNHTFSNQMGAFIAAKTLENYSDIVENVSEEHLEPMMQGLIETSLYNMNDSQAAKKLDNTLINLLKRSPNLARVPQEKHYFWAGGDIPNNYLVNAANFVRLNPKYTTNIWTDNVQSIEKRRAALLLNSARDFPEITVDDKLKELVCKDSIQLYTLKNENMREDVLKELVKVHGISYLEDADFDKSTRKYTAPQHGLFGPIEPISSKKDFVEALGKINFLPIEDCFKRAQKTLLSLPDNEEKKNLLQSAKELKSAYYCEAGAPLKHPASAKDLLQLYFALLGGVSGDLDVEHIKTLPSMQAPFGLLTSQEEITNGNNVFHPALLASSGNSPALRESFKQLADLYEPSKDAKRWEAKRVGTTREVLSKEFVETLYEQLEDLYGACSANSASAA